MILIYTVIEKAVILLNEANAVLKVESLNELFNKVWKKQQDKKPSCLLCILALSFYLINVYPFYNAYVQAKN